MTMAGSKNEKENDDKGQSRIIDIQHMVDVCSEDWYNTDLSHVNDCLVRLGIFLGEFHWHKHDLEDELFFVISGKLLLDIEDLEEDSSTIELMPNQMYTVPVGILHRTRAEEKTVVLMMEGNTVRPRGDP